MNFKARAYKMRPKRLNSILFQANDLEETIKRIQGHKGVVGMMIVNNDGKYVSCLSFAKFLKLEVLQ